MAVPYSQAISQYLGNHTYVKDGNTWRTVEDIQIKDGGTWRDTKAVYVKEGGTWRTVHEGDFFLFNYLDGTNQQSTLSLSSILSLQDIVVDLLKVQSLLIVHVEE